MDAAEKYNDTGHIEKAVAHVKRAMHYGGSDIPRFGAPVEWRKITMHEGKVALFDVGTIRTGDIDASSHIAAYEASDEGVDATETLKTGGIRVVPYLTHGHRMYFYYNYNESHIAGLFVKPSTIDSVRAVKAAINMCKLIDSTDKQKQISDLEAKQSIATEQMKTMWEKQIAKIRGDIDTSKADVDEARRQDAIDWYAIVAKTNELARSEPGAEIIAQCIFSHLARRKLLSAEELRRVARYSEQNVGLGSDTTPYKGLVCVDHTGVSIADQSGNVRYVHTYVTRNKPDGSIRLLDVKNEQDTSALCDMRAASRLIRDPLAQDAQKGPIVYCLTSSGENQCTLFAEIGDEKTGAVSCIYVAPYFDTNDKLGQVSLLALSPVAAPHVTRDIAGAVTTANAIGIQGTTGERAFVSRVRLFLLLMHFQSFAPGGRAESFALQTKAGRCTAGISAQDANETTITIHDHDPETRRITSTRVALTGTDTVLDALRIAMKLNQ